jgi:hypothetical protein
MVRRSWHTRLRGALALKVVVPFFKGFQKLVRTFSPWGRHFPRVCQKRIARRCKRKKFEGFENFGRFYGRKFTSLVSLYPAAFPGLF